MRPLDVSFLNFELQSCVFEKCTVTVRSDVGGNAYGGGVSVYIGGYSSVFSETDAAIASAGMTAIRNAILIMNAAVFTSCSARKIMVDGGSGDSCGGSFSFYIGAYAWSYSGSASSSSSCASTSASGLTVNISNAPCANCSATTIALDSNGAKSYGGSMNALHVGAYAWSYSVSASSSSSCASTDASGLTVNISNAPCANCSATTTALDSNGAKSYGGSMSALHVGAYAWSYSVSANSSSSCASTDASGLTVNISNAPCANCSAVTTTASPSNGANSYGGSMSALHVGAYAWSYSVSANSSSSCASTSASGLTVNISNAPCANCSAVTTTASDSNGVNSYGGSMSALHVGAYAWSYSVSANSSSLCASTSASGLTVNISNAPCANCSAVTTIALDSNGAKSYGGSMSALHVGAYAWSLSESVNSSSSCASTDASGLTVNISNAPCANCSAVTTTASPSNGAKSYGGSMSALHVGAYAWSHSESASSSSLCASTNASGLTVNISNAPCANCSAVTTAASLSSGAKSYGGSMSALHVGAYAWSLSGSASSSSLCASTSASGLTVNISNAPCANCSAVTTAASSFYGAKSYGGSMSALHVGAYAWSLSVSASSSSSCASTSASGLTVNISNAPCANCSATTIALDSNGAKSYGGSMSALHVGAYAWSYSVSANSSSSCASTDASGLTVNISNAPCANCSAVTTTALDSNGAKSYGGSMSALHVGAYAWSFSDAFCNSVSVFQFRSVVSAVAMVDMISVMNSVVHLFSIDCRNCSAVSSTSGLSGSLSSLSVFGGAVSILQRPWIFSQNFNFSSILTNATGSNLSVIISHSSFVECFAVTSPSSVQPGAANSGGGAVYANSAALSNITLRESDFNSCYVRVTSGYVGNQDVASYSAGGALAVDVPGSNMSVGVKVFSSSFFNCSAQGARIPSVAVRGGAVAISRASYVQVTSSTFINCNIMDALVKQDWNGTKRNGVFTVVSGGAGMSVALARNVLIDGCTFHTAGGQDSSEASIGLLILASDSTPSRTNISDTAFSSSSVVLNVLCVGDAAAQSVPCVLSKPFVHISNSNVTEYELSDASDTSNTSLISLRINVTSSFNSFRMFCMSTNSVSRADDSDFVRYSCGPCRPFEISLSGAAVFVENLTDTTQFGRCVVLSAKRCPFGLSECTTFVNITSGFWTDWTDLSNISRGFPSTVLRKTTRCPPGYCSCNHDSCRLSPPSTIDRSPNPLCANNRTGRLCGGCPINFTHSMNDKSCIENTDCINNLGWVWFVSILGFALYSLYIVLSCGELGDNALSCVLFYFQISSFALIPDNSTDSQWILQISQVRSLVTFAARACYGPSMSAYDATASRLIGPLFVFVFSAFWTWIVQALRPWLLQRNIQIQVSYSGTLAATILFVFSSVCSVVFTLVNCTSYDANGLVFIDGTHYCLDNNWKGLMLVVIILCLFPVAFVAALRHDKFPADARAVICRAFTEPAFYWPVLTLGFRLLISVMQFLQVDYPNLLAFLCMVLSVAVLIVLVNLRPHLLTHTFWVDVACYSCLAAQFGLQTMFAEHDYLGVSDTDDQREFSQSMRTLSLTFRFAPLCRRVLHDVCR
jgi:hypothetical protein